MTRRENRTTSPPRRPSRKQRAQEQQRLAKLAETVVNEALAHRDGHRAGRGGRRRGSADAAVPEPRGLWWRNRKQLLPHACAALLAAIGWIGSVAAAATAAPMAVAAVVGAVSGSAGAAALLAARRRIRAGWAAWWLLVVAALAAWLTAATAVGITGGTAAWLLIATTVLSARWWRLHRHPYPDSVDTEPRGIGENVPQRWRDKLAAQGRVLAGSAVIDQQPFAAGDGRGQDYTVRLDGGKQSLESVTGNLAKVATALEVPLQRLLVEAHPSDNPALVTVKVVERSPVVKPQFFRGPELRGGKLVLGPYADGMSQAEWVFTTPKRLWGGLVVGGTGSGKSRLLEVIGLGGMQLGLHIVHIDGQDGASCPLLWQHAPRRAGRLEADDMLDEVLAWHVYRQAEMGNAGRAGFTIGGDFTGVLVIVDEAHALVRRDNVDRWATLAREGSKTGVALVMADQDGSLKTWIDEVLRASLKAGNCIGLRTESRSAGQIVANGKFNLFDLPALPGFGYTLGARAARTAPYRGLWAPDRDDVTGGERGDGPRIPRELPLIEEWFQRIPSSLLDDHTTRGGGRPHRTGPVPAAPAPPPGIPFIPPLTPARMATAAGGAVAAPTVQESAERVLSAIRGGQASPAEIITETGLSAATVHRQLGALIKRGQVQRAGRGEYEVTERSHLRAVQ